jgi:hypothetical protein
MATFLLTLTSAVLVCHAAFSAHQYISLSGNELPRDVLAEVFAAFFVLLIGQTVANSSELKSIEKEDDKIVRTLSSLDVSEYMHFNHRGKTLIEILRSKGGAESKKSK